MKPLRALPEEIGFYPVFKWCLVLERHGWRKVMPRSKHPQKASDEAIEASKKIKAAIEGSFNNLNHEKHDRVRLMFQDEAGFGRINKPNIAGVKRVQDHQCLVII